MQETQARPRDTEPIKTKLKSYGRLQRKIEYQITRLENLMDTIDSLPATNYSGMPSGPHDGTSKAERYVEKKDELERKIRKMVKEEKQLKEELEELIALLSDPDEQAILEIRYIDCFEWEDVSFALYGAEVDYGDNPERYMKRTFRIHGAALQRLAAVYPA